MMIVKKVAGIACFGLFFLFSTSYANVVLKMDDDNCAKLEGAWRGTGTVTALGGAVQCHYSSEDSKITNKSPTDISLDVNLQKDSGPCPDSAIYHLEGTCKDGELVLKSDKAYFSGKLADDGKSAEMTGTVTITVKIFGVDTDVDADVDPMHIEKK